MLKWNGGAGSLIRVGLRESEGEERETMIVVNEASQYWEECRRMYQLLEHSVLLSRVGQWKSRPGRQGWDFKEGTGP